jgi:ParB family chromosome partitioning protein
MAKTLYNGINAVNNAHLSIKQEAVEAKNTSNNQPKKYYDLIPLEHLSFDSNIRSESEYTEEDINELAKSMKKFGQLQPICVYRDKKDKYIIIFGHRRYLAAKKLGLRELTCHIIPKPIMIDKIYMQAVENEHFKRLSPRDRENYIKVLRDMGESFENIAHEIGKSESWVRECSVAGEVREKYQDLLETTGIEFGTKEAYSLRNATVEQAEETINEIVEHPENKTILLRRVNKRTKKKMNVGKKPKDTKTSVDPTLEMELDTSVNLIKKEEKMRLLTKHIDVGWDDNQKNFSVKINDGIDSNESFVQSLIELICQQFTRINYSQV